MKIEEGHYKGKHPATAKADPLIQDAVKRKIVDGTISCREAEDIAHTLVKSLPEVGTALDLMEISIVKCQLGLFGYHPQPRIITPAQHVDPLVEQAVRDKLIDGRLPCQAAWEVAKAFSRPRIDISSVCEAIGVKIGTCQLGAF